MAQRVDAEPEATGELLLERFSPPDRAACRALCEEKRMTSKVADSIRRGLEEALAYAEGTADANRYGVRGKADRARECAGCQLANTHASTKFASVRLFVSF
jgi:hypothetical protein